MTERPTTARQPVLLSVPVLDSEEPESLEPLSSLVDGSSGTHSPLLEWCDPAKHSKPAGHSTFELHSPLGTQVFS